jgi:anaerobic magnesium-protoporphyrin IX monomethyl ester cyclase
MIALLNPTSARWRHRFPLSILHLGSMLEDKYPYEIVDQNFNPQALKHLEGLARDRRLKYLGITVMPGPQLFEAIPISKYLKSRFPDLRIIWGGYFATLHASTVLESGYVDFVVRGPGEKTFLELIDILEGNRPAGFQEVRGLSFIREGRIIHNEQREPTDPNQWLPLPYHRIQGERYVGSTYLGRRTAAYYSSTGCPFLCGFCAIASIYRARWVARAPDAIVNDLVDLQKKFSIDAVEFFDENFFTSEKRTREFSEKMIGRGITWWAEGRPDTVLDYHDDSLRAMKQAGCKMIFFGAESSSQEVLERMHKGGTQTPDTVLRLAERLRNVGIVPEFSFVLGSPSENVDADLDRDFNFIRTLMKINPLAEIIFYTYAPVVFEDSELSIIGRTYGFKFPRTLDEWMRPEWQKFDLRKSPAIPWLKPRHYARIRNFERVLNACYPTKSDIKLSRIHHVILKILGNWRYNSSIYAVPYEIAAFQRLIRYRQPEIEGF